MKKFIHLGLMLLGLTGFGALGYSVVNAAAPAQVNGCVYNATPPTLTDKQSGQIQCDASGNILTAATFSPTSTLDTNIVEVGGNTVTTTVPTADSTVATDVGVPGSTACATDTSSCNLNALMQRVAQRITSLIAALGGTGTTGAAVPATAAYIGVNVGGNLVGVAPGTAGSAATQVFTVQGVASMTAVQTATTTIGSTAIAVGNGGISNGVQRVAIADINVGEYETVAASATNQVLGATGATGDYLLQLVCVPATTSPGVVTVLDNASALVSFPGGASSVSNLLPFTIPVNAYSVSGAWKVTTGSNVSCVGVGNFT